VNYGDPPGTARAIWFIGRLALRRLLNRWLAYRFRRNTATAGAKRCGTATKSGRRSVFGGVLFLLMVFSGVVVSSAGIARISAITRNIRQARDKFVVTPYTYASLEQVDQALQQLKILKDSGEREKLRAMWDRQLDRLFASEIRWGAYTDAEEGARLHQMRTIFQREGIAGFAPAQTEAFHVSAATLPQAPKARSAFIGILSALYVLWIPMSVLLALGFNNKDLGQVEWSLEWLYSFPVAARALFLSRLLVYSIFDQMVWWLLLPFSVLAFVAIGCGWAALLFGAGATLYLALVAGSISTVAEVVLRKYLNLRRLKNTQALFTVLGTICLLIFYTAMFSTPIADLLSHLAGSSPSLLAWNPIALPLTFAAAGLNAWQRLACVMGMACGITITILLATTVSEWLTADGLIRAGGPYQGSRRRLETPAYDSWFKGVAAHELLLFRRDRNLLVQVLIVPLLIPAYYLFIDQHLRTVLTGSFRRAAMVSFLVGAYSFVSSAIPVLSRENKTLWFLFSLPRSLVSILLEKTAFWAAFGVLYGAAIVALLFHFSPNLHVTSWSGLLLVFYGIALYAFIASGIGILAADVFETEPRAQLKISLIYLYFVLAAMYANVFYSISLWTCLAQLVLTTLLAFALWQKVRDMAPYVLDPTQWPPRTISVADGMVAALAFFVAQPLMQALFQTSTTLPVTVQITVSYLMAGLVVAAAVLIVLWLQSVPDLWEQLGLAAFSKLPTARAAIQGLVWGGLAALGAIAYLHVLDLFPQWHIWKQDAEVTSFLAPGAQPLWIWVLLVIAAPLIEEFLFRGLIFHGLRRTTGPILAIVGSAALFALVHPPIAVIPVFGLGIAAAISLNQSGFLLAPILAHAVYNSCMLFLNRI
jgi:ABC-2 type transport system permease protein